MLTHLYVINWIANAETVFLLNADEVFQIRLWPSITSSTSAAAYFCLVRPQGTRGDRYPPEPCGDPCHQTDPSS